MELTRSFLKERQVPDDVAEEIIEAHVGTTSVMAAELEKYKADAAKLHDVQKELDALKANGGFEAKYNAEHKAFEDYKADIAAKETKAAKHKAGRAYFEGKGLTGENLEIVMRGSAAELDALELDDGKKIKDTSALDGLLGGVYKKFVPEDFERGADVGGEHHTDGGRVYTREAIRNMSPDEINKNWDAVKAALKGS